MAEENIPLEKIYDRTKSMYKLVILAAKRALELNEGAAKLVETSSDKIANIALKEISEGKVSYKPKPEKK